MKALIALAAMAVAMFAVTATAGAATGPDAIGRIATENPPASESVRSAW